MKSKSLLSLLFLAVSLVASGQEIKFGLKGGLNSVTIGDLFHRSASNSGGSNVIPAEDFTYSPEKEISYHLGGFVNFRIKRVMIRPEVVYTKLKSAYALAARTSYWNSTKMDFNFALGYEVYDPVIIYGFASLSNTSEMTMDGLEDTSFADAGVLLYEENSINFGAGIMFDFRWFGLDLRYEYGGTPFDLQRIDMVRDPAFGGYGTNVADLLEYNPTQLILSVHVNLFAINTDEKRVSRKGWRGKCKESLF